MCMSFDPDTYTEFHKELWTAVRENLSEEERDRCFAQAHDANLAVLSYAASLGSHYFKTLEHKAAISSVHRSLWIAPGGLAIILGASLFRDLSLNEPQNLFALFALFVFQLFLFGILKSEERSLNYECYRLEIKLREERLKCAEKLPNTEAAYIQSVIEPFCALLLVQGELQGITEEFPEFGRKKDRFLDSQYIIEESSKQKTKEALGRLHIKKILQFKLLCYFANPVSLQHGLDTVSSRYNRYGYDFYEPLSWDYAKFRKVHVD